MEKVGTENAEAIMFLAFAKMLAIVFFARRIYEDPRALGLLIWPPVPIEPVTAPLFLHAGAKLALDISLLEQLALFILLFSACERKLKFHESRASIH